MDFLNTSVTQRHSLTRSVLTVGNPALYPAAPLRRHTSQTAGYFFQICLPWDYWVKLKDPLTPFSCASACEQYTSLVLS